jgi:phosphoserine phosphatase
MSAEHLLASWNDTPTRAAIVDYVARVTGDGPDHVGSEERIAVFDNDGTLWCEKPMPIQLAYILERLAEMAAADESLRDRQPWKAAYERDLHWLGNVITKHDAGLTVDEYGDSADSFVAGTTHPTNGRLYRECAYQPMIELLRYLEANGFSTFIASAGDRDFMRPFADDLYGIPAERVIGSSNALRYDDDAGTLAYLAEPDVFDDGPVKPVRIWSRIGRRPIFAGGNANGDIPMLRFAGGEHPAFRLLIRHDDAEREFDYATGAETALQRAVDEDWTVVSVKDDWATVYADA